MNKILSAIDAQRALRDSLEKPLIQSAAYVPSFERGSDYLARMHAQLVAAAVEPMAILLRPDSSARTFGDWQDRDYSMFLVAQDKTDVLLIDAETGLFALGHRDESGRISLVGFSSDDALAEWVS